MKRKSNETAADAFIPTIKNAPAQVIETKGAVTVIDDPAMPLSIDAGKIIEAAATGGASVETMEKLLAMRRELKAEWGRDQYFSALARFQSECPSIAKNKIVRDKSGKPRYAYAPLDSIIEQTKAILERHGFSYTVTVKQEPGVGTVTAGCNSHHKDGHSEYTEFTVPIDYESYMNASQKVASALTYAKRYVFCNAFGIMTSDEDDDSNSQEPKAGAPTPPPPARTPAPVAPRPAAAPVKIDYTVCPRTKARTYDGKKWADIPTADLQKFSDHFGGKAKNADGTINEINAGYFNEISAALNSDQLDAPTLAEMEAAAANDEKASGELFGGIK